MSAHDPSAVDPAVALAVSVIALVVAVAAAGFTGWQAWVAHLTRSDARRVLLGLRLIDQTERSRDRGKWFVENGGKGEAVNIDVTFTFAKGENVHTYRTRVGLLPSLGSELLVFADREPPQPDTRLKGSETERVRDYLSASALYSLPGSRKRRSASLELPPAVR